MNLTSNHGSFNHGAIKDLLCENKVLLLVNEHADPSFLFENLVGSCNINNQYSKFDKNLSTGSISVE